MRERGERERDWDLKKCVREKERNERKLGLEKI